LSGSTKANSIHLLLSGIVVVTLLTWGSYAVLAVSTFPSDQGSITSAALRGVSFASAYTGNGTVIRPNSQAQFLMAYQSKVVLNPNQAWPQSYSVPSGEGYGLGPFLATQPSSNFSRCGMLSSHFHSVPPAPCLPKANQEPGLAVPKETCLNPRMVSVPPLFPIFQFQLLGSWRSILLEITLFTTLTRNPQMRLEKSSWGLVRLSFHVRGPTCTWA